MRTIDAAARPLSGAPAAFPKALRAIAGIPVRILLKMVDAIPCLERGHPPASRPACAQRPDAEGYRHQQVAGRFRGEQAILAELSVGTVGMETGAGTDADGAEILFAVEPGLSVAEFVDVLARSGLGERRPVGDLDRIGTMLEHADMIVTARAGGVLVGVARSVTDFSFCCYLSDLAVDRQWQGRGIGTALMARTKTAATAKVSATVSAASCCPLRPP